MLLENDKSMKKIIISLSLCLVGCSETNYESNRFYQEARAIFQDYPYKIVYGQTNTESILLNLEIDKKDITIADLNQLKLKIVQRGWDYNYDLDDYYWSYCSDTSHDAIQIYYPNEKVVKDRNGDYFSGSLNPNVVHIWMTNYKSDDHHQETTECKAAHG